MAMNRIDTAKFIVSLTERIMNENPSATDKDLYSKVFSACSPLIINGDLDSQLWVDMSEYLFPSLAGKNKNSEYVQKIERLEREHEQAAKKNRELAREKRRLEIELEEEKKKSKKSVSIPVSRSVSVSSSYSSDPCARTSFRSGGC